MKTQKKSESYLSWVWACSHQRNHPSVTDGNLHGNPFADFLIHYSAKKGIRACSIHFWEALHINNNFHFFLLLRPHWWIFFSSCAREKRMNSSQWVPLSRRIWRHGTDFSSRASQNLLPHPIPKVAQQKAFKGGKGTFSCHSISAQMQSWSCSLCATVPPYLFCIKTEQFIKCTRLSTVLVPGVRGFSSWTSPGMGGEQALAAGWAESHSSFLLPQLLPATLHRCAHTFAPSLALTHSLFSGLTLTFFLERMCSLEAHDCDVWLFINTSMLNSFSALQRNIS